MAHTKAGNTLKNLTAVNDRCEALYKKNSYFPSAFRYNTIHINVDDVVCVWCRNVHTTMLRQYIHRVVDWMSQASHPHPNDLPPIHNSSTRIHIPATPTCKQSIRSQTTATQTHTNEPLRRNACWISEWRNFPEAELSVVESERVLAHHKFL